MATDANRINLARDALTALSPGLERAIIHRFGQSGVRDLISRWSTPAELHAADKTKIHNLIKKRSPRIAAKVANEIWAALDTQTLTIPAAETWGQVVRELLNDIERVQHQRDRLADQIEEAFLSHPFGQVLVTPCGFGPRTGARTLAEIVNGAFQHRGCKHSLKNTMFL